MPIGEFHRRIVTMAIARDDLSSVVAEIRETIVADTSPAGELLRDAFSIDAALLDEQIAHTDFVAHYCEELCD